MSKRVRFGTKLRRPVPGGGLQPAQPREHVRQRRQRRQCSFGMITGYKDGNRRMQLGFKFEFSGPRAGRALRGSAHPAPSGGHLRARAHARVRKGSSISSTATPSCASAHPAPSGGHLRAPKLDLASSEAPHR